MKKTIFLIAAIISLMSCQSKQEKLIKEHEERINDKTTIDLKLKVKELNQVGVSTAKDSLEYYSNLIEIAASKLKIKIQYELQETQANYDNKKIEYKYESNPSIKAIYKKSMSSSENIISMEKEILDLIESKNYKDLNKEITMLLDKKDSFSIQDSIIGNIWDCTYTIINPALNNAKQTFDAKYLFSPDNELLLKKISF